jgi:hypothetical protein
MRTKKLGWSSTRASRARRLALALIASSLAVVAQVGPSYAADQKKVRDKMVELNKKALLSYEAKEFDAARDLLIKALKEAKQAGLDDDKMTARTYLHLGAVYWVGFQNQAAAIENFTLSKKIRPDIQLTPSIETSDLKSVFDLAVIEPEPTPTPEPSKPSTTPTPEPTPALASSSEPDLPSTMPAPLMCATPEDSPPGKELTIRCALKPGIRADSVQLHYRAPGAESYQSLAMRRTPKGWYMATLPARAMQGSSIQVYYDARDARDNQVASNGQEDSPSVIEIRKKAGGAGRGGGSREGDPLAGIKRQQEEERYEAGLHRRREGAIWIGMGGGLGWGYAPAGALEWAKTPKTDTQPSKPIQVSAVTTTTGLFQFVPEIGYMWTDNFSISAQMRLEYIRQDQLRDERGNVVPATNRTGAPAQWAPAFFLRGLWFFDVSSSGNFQFLTGASLGGGYVRLPVKPQALQYKTVTNPDTGATSRVPDENWSIILTDTRPIGTVLLGPSGGFVYHVSRFFGVMLEGRALLGFPAFGFAVEGNLSAFLAFGGKGGRAHEEEEEEEGEMGAIHDSPTSDEPPTSEDSLSSPGEEEE